MCVSFFGSTFEQFSTGDAQTLNLFAREMRSAEAGWCVIKAGTVGGWGGVPGWSGPGLLDRRAKLSI